MEFALFVWLASVIESAAAFLTSLGVLLLISIAMWLAANLFCRSEYHEEYRENTYNRAGLNIKSKWWKFGVFVSVFFIFIGSVLPSQKTLYIMAGAYAGQQAIQSETAGKVVKLVNSKLDEYLAEAEKSLNK